MKKQKQHELLLAIILELMKICVPAAFASFSDTKIDHILIFQVHLDGTPRVGSVAITISPGSYQHFTIFVVELMEGNKAMYKPCAKFEGRFQVQENMHKDRENMVCEKNRVLGYKFAA